LRTINQNLGPSQAFAARCDAAVFNAQAQGACAALRISGEGEELVKRGEAA
jgi:hypothetical protein